MLNSVEKPVWACRGKVFLRSCDCDPPENLRTTTGGRERLASHREVAGMYRVWIPVAGPTHRSILRGLLNHLGGGSRLIADAHLAALAIEHGLILCSSDGDFARFPGLRWINPLAA